MPKRERMQQLVQQLVEAALDQPNPSNDLRRALRMYLDAVEHSCRILPFSKEQRWQRQSDG